MSTTVHLSSTPAHPKRLRTVVTALASLATCYALLQSLKLVDADAPIAHGRLALQITTAHLIVAPFFAVAALVFARRDRLSFAIMALAAIVLTTWASELASAHFTVATLGLAHSFQPVLAVLAIILAVRHRWLGVAAVVVANMWTLWFWITLLTEVIPFVIAVMIYGP